MTIAIASGKGGTGKTTIAVSLALSLNGSVKLLDCDVEEPNAGLFLDLIDKKEKTIDVLIPKIDDELCTSCGECASFCQFASIVHVGSTVMLFPEMCHSCGGCAMVCPVNAIEEVDERIGVLTKASIKNTKIEFVQGLLDIGKAISIPLIDAVKESIDDEDFTIIDSPPGTSCPMVATILDVDFVLLVTEPTPFGIHDLILAKKNVKKMGLPFGVIVNRSNSYSKKFVKKLEKKNIPILMEIDEDIKIAKAYSRGIPLVEAAPEYREEFANLPNKISELIKKSKNEGRAE